MKWNEWMPWSEWVKSIEVNTWNEVNKFKEVNILFLWFDKDQMVIFKAFVNKWIEVNKWSKVNKWLWDLNYSDNEVIES